METRLISLVFNAILSLQETKVMMEPCLFGEGITPELRKETVLRESYGTGVESAGHARYSYK